MFYAQARRRRKFFAVLHFWNTIFLNKIDNLESKFPNFLACGGRKPYFWLSEVVFFFYICFVESTFVNVESFKTTNVEFYMTNVEKKKVWPRTTHPRNFNSRFLRTIWESSATSIRDKKLPNACKSEAYKQEIIQ